MQGDGHGEKQAEGRAAGAGAQQAQHYTIYVWFSKNLWCVDSFYGTGSGGASKGQAMENGLTGETCVLRKISALLHQHTDVNIHGMYAHTDRSILP